MILVVKSKIDDTYQVVQEYIKNYYLTLSEELISSKTNRVSFEASKQSDCSIQYIWDLSKLSNYTKIEFRFKDTSTTHKYIVWTIVVTTLIAVISSLYDFANASLMTIPTFISIFYLFRIIKMNNEASSEFLQFLNQQTDTTVIDEYNSIGQSLIPLHSFIIAIEILLIKLMALYPITVLGLLFLLVTHLIIIIDNLFSNDESFVLRRKSTIMIFAWIVLSMMCLILLATLYVLPGFVDLGAITRLGTEYFNDFGFYFGFIPIVFIGLYVWIARHLNIWIRNTRSIIGKQIPFLNPASGVNTASPKENKIFNTFFSIIICLSTVYLLSVFILLSTLLIWFFNYTIIFPELTYKINTLIQIVKGFSITWGSYSWLYKTLWKVSILLTLSPLFILIIKHIFRILITIKNTILIISKPVPNHLFKLVDDECRTIQIKTPQIMVLDNLNVLIESTYKIMRNKHVILINERLTSILSDTELLAVIRHELAHIKYDCKKIAWLKFLSYFTLFPFPVLTIPYDFVASEIRADKFSIMQGSISQDLKNAILKLSYFSSVQHLKTTKKKLFRIRGFSKIVNFVKNYFVGLRILIWGNNLVSYNYLLLDLRLETLKSDDQKT